MARAQETAARQHAELEAKTTEPAAKQESNSDEPLPLGVVREKPSSGRFVEIEGGFMVPYVVTIPGSEATFTMMPIPGGTFTMGSPATEAQRDDDEGPQFDVAIKPAWIGKHEVTWGEFKLFMQLGPAVKDLQRSGLRKVDENNEVDAVSSPSELYDPAYIFSFGEGDDQPAASMTQFSAKQYTKWLSLLTENFYRLPSEAEWEYACRAGSKSAYSFGSDLSKLGEYGWFVANAGLERQPVGKLRPNPWGLHDMHGNVAEWVLDGYESKGYFEFEKGGAVTVDDAFTPPRGVHPRVARGGSFEMQASDCRSAARLGSSEEWALEDPNYPKSPFWYTDSPASGVGFRIYRPLKVPSKQFANIEFWSDDKVSLKNAKLGAVDQGRGALVPVDPRLPQDLLEQKAQERRSK